MFSRSRQLEIEWGHCDPAGIVFNPRYFEMFDHSTAGLIDAALGMKKLAWRETWGILGTPLVASSARFLAPCRFGDVVTIVSTVTRIGRSSFEIAHVLTGPSGPAVEATDTRVWAGRDPDDPEGMKARPLPEDVRAALEREAA